MLKQEEEKRKTLEAKIEKKFNEKLEAFKINVERAAQKRVNEAIAEAEEDSKKKVK